MAIVEAVVHTVGRLARTRPEKKNSSVERWRRQVFVGDVQEDVVPEKTAGLTPSSLIGDRRSRSGYQVVRYTCIEYNRRRASRGLPGVVGRTAATGVRESVQASTLQGRPAVTRR